MEKQVPKPIDCILDPKRGLMYVKWQDLHESLIPLDVVRRNCPCIECLQLRENQDPLQTVQPHHLRISSEPQGVEELGNHALLIIWKDGHQTGIYPWSHLRSLCPCEQCTTEQSNET